ncbi:unnamed protein product [Prunus brigantina]
MKKVYSDCHHRLNDREVERQRSPTRINARLRDLRMTVLGNKSPIRKVRGLESVAESDHKYVPSKSQESTYPEIPSSDFFFRKFRRWKTTGLALRSPTGETFSHDHSPNASSIPGRTEINEGQCLLFPSALTGAALNWSYHLEPGTVDSFDELKQIFLNHFMIQTDRLYSADDLYTIRQREDEPLREYAARFNHEYSRCPKTNDKAA